MICLEVYRPTLEGDTHTNQAPVKSELMGRLFKKNKGADETSEKRLLKSIKKSEKDLSMPITVMSTKPKDGTSSSAFHKELQSSHKYNMKEFDSFKKEQFLDRRDQLISELSADPKTYQSDEESKQSA
jgi:hypothetical protein